MNDHNNSVKRFSGVSSTLILALVCVLAGCVEPRKDKDAPEPSELTRVLNDSPVNGVTYTCDNHTDETKNGGQFLCATTPVVFRIGELILGQIDSFNSDNQVFPQDLAGVTRDDFLDEQTLKISRLLQSLDDDGVLAEAIDIPDSIAERFQSYAHVDDNSLEELANMAGVELVSKAFAIAHLKRSLNGGQDRFDYIVRIRFTDVNSGDLLATDVNFTVKGAEVLDSESNPVSRVSLGGILKSTTLYLRNLPEPGQDIRIMTQADGYLDSGISLALSDSQLYYEMNLKLVKSTEGKLANGVFSSAELIASRVDISGKVIEAIVLNNQEASGKPAFKLTIPENTLFTDKDGKPVAAKELKITGFEPTEADALSAFPGGLKVLADASGLTRDGVTETGFMDVKLKPISFAAISIVDDSGNRVKHFSENIDVKMQFPIGTKNGLDNDIAIGDEIPIWSYDEDVGQWRFEQLGTVQDIDTNDGFYDVVYNVDHLSYWTLAEIWADWTRWGGSYAENGVCLSTPRFYMSDPLNSSNSMLSFEFNLQREDGNTVLQYSIPDLRQRETGYFQLDSGFPIGRPATLIVRWQPSRDLIVNKLPVIVAIVTLVDVCAGGDISVLFSYEDLQYDEAKTKSDALSAESDKSAGVKPIVDDISYLLDTAALRAIDDPERSDELFQLAATHALEYSAAFIESPGYVGATPNIYGCDESLFNYVKELLENFYYQEVYLGPWAGMSISEVLPYFVTAGNVFIGHYPDQLSYAPYGIRGFVECGYRIAGELAAFGDESDLQSFITDHFEDVITINVASITADIELEMANNGIISIPSAATFDYIISEATVISNELAASGSYTTAGLNVIAAARTYYDQLEATGKIGGGITD